LNSIRLLRRCSLNRWGSATCYIGAFFTYNLEEGKPAGAVADQRNRDQKDSVCDRYPR
jgi:hypothetical protein